ncbi:type II secretion system secretin GspD [Thermodesulfatator autotrophicus]|uniref:Uncharacterized protein n=1 Tax=Thermodesulfatator autotrophicus TaxID=1795632 RepID=A0A177E8C9_9BACT|nr:type II secretion system secretin GspD [Thermodesulfatator autotrophicus]OAG28217.1 hypothetical protein TH606_02910 [Thermodesulfatator autotrophicus]
MSFFLVRGKGENMKISYLLVLLGLILGLCGCQAGKTLPESMTATFPPPPVANQTSELKSNSLEKLPDKDIAFRKPQEEKTKSPVFVILQSGKRPETKEETPKIKTSQKGGFELTLDLEGASLMDFLDLLFKQTLKVNYTISPQARARITAHIHGTFSHQELMEITSQVLELNGLSLVPSPKLYRIVPASELSRVSGNISFAVLRPRFLPINEVTRLIQSLLTPNARVLAGKTANTLIVIDNPENLAKITHLVNLLDEDVLAEMNLALYRPQVLNAETLANYLKAIFKAGPWKGINPSSFVDFIPMKEINSLLIIAKDPETIKRVYRWIKELDKGELAEQEVYVYQVENGNAEEIAQILQDTFSGTGSYSSRKTIMKAQKKKVSPELIGDIRIIPDKTNNLLIIKATRQDYLTIKRLLEKIDVLPRQVVIEMLIMEITLNRELEHGVEWFLKNRTTYRGDTYNLGSKFSRSVIEEGVLENIEKVNLPGLAISIYRANDLGALFNILQSVSQINILSNPVILATDNKEARIQIGQEVPIITQQITNTSATEPNITSTVQYRDTGIILSVKPTINSSGLVKLDIVQEISSAQKNYLGLENTPLISKRKIETSLVVKNNQTVILGGLIDNRQEVAETGIPVFKDLPFLGHLFKWQKKTRDRTELLIAITPRVVRNYQEAETVMFSFKQKIENLKKRLEEQNSKGR